MMIKPGFVDIEGNTNDPEFSSVASNQIRNDLVDRVKKQRLIEIGDHKYKFALSTIVQMLLANHDKWILPGLSLTTGYRNLNQETIYKYIHKIFIPGSINVSRDDTLNGDVLSYTSQSLDSTYDAIMDNVVGATKGVLQTHFINGVHVLSYVHEDDLLYGNQILREMENVYKWEKTLDGSKMFSSLYPLGQKVNVPADEEGNLQKTEYIRMGYDYETDDMGNATKEKVDGATRLQTYKITEYYPYVIDYTNSSKGKIVPYWKIRAKELGIASSTYKIYRKHIIDKNKDDNAYEYVHGTYAWVDSNGNLTLPPKETDTESTDFRTPMFFSMSPYGPFRYYDTKYDFQLPAMRSVPVNWSLDFTSNPVMLDIARSELVIEFPEIIKTLGIVTKTKQWSGAVDSWTLLISAIEYAKKNLDQIYNPTITLEAIDLSNVYDDIEAIQVGKKYVVDVGIRPMVSGMPNPVQERICTKATIQLDDISASTYEFTSHVYSDDYEEPSIAKASISGSMVASKAAARRAESDAINTSK